jgi:TatD DNase family protein
VKNPFIDIHTHKRVKSEDEIALFNFDLKEVKKPLKMDFSAGIHPWSIDKGNLYTKKVFLERYAKNKKTSALGECGLDKLIETPLLEQLEVFGWHIKLSEKYQKPLIIHCVRAFNELFETRKAYKATLSWVLHGFNKNENILKDVLKRGLYVSFGEALFDEKSNANHYFKTVPNNQFFLETDISEHSIQKIYEKAAFLKQISVEELKQIIYNNYQKVFKNG